MTIALALLLLAIIAFQFYASVIVVRCSPTGTTLRYRQLALVWLLPVVGAGVFLLFARSDGLSGHPTEVFHDSGYDGGNDFGQHSEGGSDGGGGGDGD